MEINLKKTNAPGMRSLPGYIKWLKFSIGILLIGIFMFGVGPLVLKNEAAQILAQEIDEKEIEAGALWWSEVEIVADAEMNCRNTVEYLPKGPVVNN